MHAYFALLYSIAIENVNSMEGWYKISVELSFFKSQLWHIAYILLVFLW